MPDGGSREFLAAYDAALARWPVPVDPVQVPTPFGGTRVNRCGPAGGAPLVLLAGGGATSTAWFANVGALSRAHRVLAVDVMGDAGRSVPDRRMRTGPQLMSWLDAVLDRLELDAAHVCGHSYGARIALGYALHAPRRVRRLALLDPTGCFAGLSPRYLRHALPLLVRPSGARFRALVDWETGGAPLDPAWLELAAAGTRFPTRLVVPRRPSRRQLRELDVPTLVVLAGRSRAHDMRRVAARASRLPHVTVTELPDVSHHGMPSVHADRLNRELLAFLD